MYKIINCIKLKRFDLESPIVCMVCVYVQLHEVRKQEGRWVDAQPQGYITQEMVRVLLSPLTKKTAHFNLSVPVGSYQLYLQSVDLCLTFNFCFVIVFTFILTLCLIIFFICVSLFFHQRFISYYYHLSFIIIIFVFIEFYLNFHTLLYLKIYMSRMQEHILKKGEKLIKLIKSY